MCLLAAFQRKLLKGDLLRDRDFTLPELEGVAGVELEPGAGWAKRNAWWGRDVGGSRALFFVLVYFSKWELFKCARTEAVEDKVGEKENKIIQSNKNNNTAWQQSTKAHLMLNKKLTSKHRTSKHKNTDITHRVHAHTGIHRVSMVLR